MVEFLGRSLGGMGEVLDYRLCVTLGAGVTLAVCWLAIWTQTQGDLFPGVIV